MPIHTFHIKWRLTLTDTEGPNPNPTDPILTITNTGEGILQSGDIALVQSINQSHIFTVVQVIKSLQDPLEVGNNLPGINDKVRE